MRKLKPILLYKKISFYIIWTKMILTDGLLFDRLMYYI